MYFGLFRASSVPDVASAPLREIVLAQSSGGQTVLFDILQTRYHNGRGR